MPFELIDSQAEVLPFEDSAERLREAGVRLKQRIRDEGIYRVVESERADTEVKRWQRQFDLVDCQGCEFEIARVADAQRVIVAWAQRATALIINLNIEVRDVDSGAVVLAKSSEMRGSTARNWERAIDHIVRSMIDKGQRNR